MTTKRRVQRRPLRLCRPNRNRWKWRAAPNTRTLCLVGAGRRGVRLRRWPNTGWRARDCRWVTCACRWQNEWRQWLPTRQRRQRPRPRQRHRTENDGSSITSLQPHNSSSSSSTTVISSNTSTISINIIRRPFKKLSCSCSNSLWTTRRTAGTRDGGPPLTQNPLLKKTI